MGTVEATRTRSGSATEFRELLDATLFELDADQKAGPLLRATGMRVRFEFPDLGMVLNVAASEAPDHHLRWEFSDAVDWEPKLNLSMDSQIANAYLQGRRAWRSPSRGDGSGTRATRDARFSTYPPCASWSRHTGGSSAATSAPARLSPRALRGDRLGRS